MVIKDCSRSDFENPITGVIFEPFGPGVSVYLYCKDCLDYIPDPSIPPMILPVSSVSIIFHNSHGGKKMLQVSEDCTSLIALPASEDELKGYNSLSSGFWVSIVEDKEEENPCRIKAFTGDISNLEK